jgi:peptidoglycan-N-acetylmuramic acid deacetylase
MFYLRFFYYFLPKIHLLTLIYFLTQGKISLKEKSMKLIKFVALLICVSAFLSSSPSADVPQNWYIVKKGNNKPLFPPETQEMDKLNGIYLDKYSSQEGIKKIYLTFDAGYENGNIEKILDVMKSEDVKGAFFILENLINKNPQLVKRMRDEGHLICNHTTRHADLTKMTEEEILYDLSKLESRYRSLTGAEMEKIFRFPEGRYSISTLKLLSDNGYKSVFWSMAYDDWDNSRQMNTDIAKKKLLSTTHEGAILLLHPTSSTNAQILGDLIKEWKSQGYSFGSLKEI